MAQTIPQQNETGRALIVLARIGAPHGVQGEVRVKSFTEDPMAIAGYGPLVDPSGQCFNIVSARPAKGVLIVRFKGVDSREAAEALKGVELGVDRSVLPEPDDADEFYHADLIGMIAVDAQGEPVGTVRAVNDYGAGDVIEIALSRGGTELVAFTRVNVPEIDIATRRLTVVLPETVAASNRAGAEE